MSPTVQFFERADVPWLDAVEAATAGLREELLALIVPPRCGLRAGEWSI